MGTCTVSQNAGFTVNGKEADGKFDQFQKSKDFYKRYSSVIMTKVIHHFRVSSVTIFRVWTTLQNHILKILLFNLIIIIQYYMGFY